jgi:hypothetical protein
MSSTIWGLIVATYHHPYCEQQFPYVDPTQVYAFVPPQLPSGEIFFDVVVMVVDVVGAVGVGVDALVVLVLMLAPAIMLQPNALWQLVQ